VADARLRASDRRGPRSQPALPGQPRQTLWVKEQVNPAAQLKPLKFRREGEFRDIPLPQYVSEAIDKHVAGHGVTPDRYLFQGRKHKLVIRRSYQQDFRRAAATPVMPGQEVAVTRLDSGVADPGRVLNPC
jgi:hypothetical protein